MSYARFSNDSDVYVYYHVDGYYKCEMCNLQDEEEVTMSDEACDIMDESKRTTTKIKKGFECDIASEMLEHLQEHKSNGDSVPDYGIERLENEKES